MSQELPLLRQSERSSFKRCATRWWWGYREGLILRGTDHGARGFGTGIHLCMAEYYVPGMKRGRPLLETWAEFTKDAQENIGIDDGNGQTMWVDARELGIDMLTQYMDAYGTDEDWEVIAPEKTFRVLIPDPKRPSSAICENVGTFDLVIRDHGDGGKLKMVDHKTAKDLNTKHLTLDDQAGSYIAMATHAMREQGLIGQKEAIRGMVYNFLRKAKADTRPVNERGMACNKPTKEHYAQAIADTNPVGAERQSEKAALMKKSAPALIALAEKYEVEVFGEESKRQPKPTLLRHYVSRTAAERNTQIKRIGAEVTVMNMFRDGTLPLIKNPTRDCSWDCDFFSLCELDEAHGDTENMKDLMYDRRDPYADHRLGAANSKVTVAADKALKRPER